MLNTSLLSPPSDQELLSIIRNSSKLRWKIMEFLGRAPDPTGAGHSIWKIQNHAIGQFFEWHPQKRIVYLVHAETNVGEAIAFDIETHGDAINAVNIFTRGYKLAAKEKELT